MSAHAGCDARRRGQAFRRAAMACCALVAFALVGCAGTTTREERRAISDGRTLIELADAADAAYLDGRYQVAAGQYLELARELPDDATVWYRLANTHARLGNERQAARAYERSLDIDPANARAWYNLAIILHRMSTAALASSHARAGRGEEDVGQESLRVLRIMDDADRAIRREGEGDRSGPLIGPDPATQEVDAHEHATQ